MNVNMYQSLRRLLMICAGLFLLGGAIVSNATDVQAQDDTGVVAEESTPEYVAIVNGKKILWPDYVLAFNNAAKETFYHGEVSDQRLLELRVKVLDNIIEETLVIGEARRRNIPIDEKLIEKRISDFDMRNADNPKWVEHRETVMANMRVQMANSMLVQALSVEIRSVDQPSKDDLMEFYENNLTMFTEPMQERVAVILLGVDPSAPQSTWVAAREEIARIQGWLQDGADFEKLAKLHSSEESSENGGDMGYLHRGMLAAPAQEKVGSLAIGELSDVVELLQGPALFKLLDRKQPVQKSFEESYDRIADLYVRSKIDEQWDRFISDQKSMANIEHHSVMLDMMKELEELKAASAAQIEDTSSKSGQ